MKILFIKLKHIGDVLLATPVIRAVRQAHPGAELWFLARRGTEGILEGCPDLDRVVTTCPPEKNLRQGICDLRNDLTLVREIRRHRFDHVFELGDSDRCRFFALASGAATRTCGGNGRRAPGPVWSRIFHHITITDWKTLHRVEKDFRTVAPVLGLPGEIPGLVFEESRCVRPDLHLPEGPFTVVHPATRWVRKQWPADRWRDLLRAWHQETGHLLVLSSGPDESERAMAATLARDLGPAALFTGGTLRWTELAWILRRARLFIGVDTAAMHLAAACGCPTVALFGPSKPFAWKPWRVAHCLARPELDETDAPVAETSLMEHIGTQQVLERARALLHGTST
jgi:heptosyltransferase-3